MKRCLLMDLGAARTRIVRVGDAALRNEPSAVMTMTDKPLRVLAVGAEADAAMERAPDNICVRRPQAEGRVADPDLVQEQLAFWRQKYFSPVSLPVLRPNLVLTIPCGAMDYERKALTDAGLAARFKTVKLVDELAAHAAGLDVGGLADEPRIVVAVGAAYAQAGVVRNGEVLTQRMIQAKNPRDGAAGNAMTTELRHWIGTTFGLSVGEDQVERLKYGETHQIVGFCSAEGCFKTVEITSEQILQAVRPVLMRLAELVSGVIDDGVQSVGESVRDSVRRQGVFLTGGGAKLRGLADFVQEAAQVPVVLAAMPEETAIRGLERLEARQ